MSISLFLAKVIGIYLLVAGIFIIRNYRSQKDVARDIIEDNALRYIFGSASLLIGLLIIAAHNNWTEGWKIVITVIGWATLLKGVATFLIPKEKMLSLIEKFGSPNWYLMGGIIWTVLGLYLSYIGFFF
jgi:uncharacterized membrane protein HdeD (DUF308 family)